MTDAVHAPVDAHEAGRDLVDGAVEVVDPALQRDGEVDQVGLAVAEQHRLALAQALDAQPAPRPRRDAARAHATAAAPIAIQAAVALETLTA